MKDENGKEVLKTLDDQIQLYAPNPLISHPLVSPINQGSLGGLCPMMIVRSSPSFWPFPPRPGKKLTAFTVLLVQMGGSGELLRDEMIFVAHKAAHPARYPPSKTVQERYPEQAKLVNAFPPTKVHLQVIT